MKIYFIMAVVIALLASAIYIQQKELTLVKIQRDENKNTANTLLSGLQKRKIEDSLNAATVGELKLSLQGLKDYRRSDLELIDKMQIKNREIQGLMTTQLQTMYSLKGNFKDSIIITNSEKKDTIRCLSIIDKWFELNGCIDNNSHFKGYFKGRDSLIYVETVKFKRFLGFLWYTNKIKNRSQQIVSKNKNTDILGAEFVTIRE